MDRSRVSHGALKYLMMIAVAMTGTFGAFVFGERPGAARATSERGPAQMDVQAKPTVLKIPCWENLEKISVPPATKWVRITGKICDGKVAADDVLVKNETNHFVATIFPLDDGLTTDLVPLHEGTNDVTVSIGPAKSAVIRHLRLDR